MTNHPMSTRSLDRLEGSTTAYLPPPNKEIASDLENVKKEEEKAGE